MFSFSRHGARCSFSPFFPPSRSTSKPTNQPITQRHNHKQVIGSIDGSGRIRLVDGNAPETPPAVDLDLEKVLGSMPNKTFSFDTLKRPLKALELPAGLAAQDALEKVLRLPSVCSKRFLTTKVDRHVTGESCRSFFSVVFLFRVWFSLSPACDEVYIPC